MLIGCQRNYYLIEEAYYKGNYTETLRLLTELEPRYPNQVSTFISHSGKRLSQKLIDTAHEQQTTSHYNMLCYIHKTLPALSQFNQHHANSFFIAAENDLQLLYDTHLNTVVDQSLQNGDIALTNQDYITAISYFKRVQSFKDTPEIQLKILNAQKNAMISVGIPPFSISPNGDSVLFGIQVSEHIFKGLETQIQKQPLHHIDIIFAPTKQLTPYTLQGVIHLDVFDTQLTPETIIQKDTLRYLHDVGGIPKWDLYDFEYTIVRTEYRVSISGLFRLNHHDHLLNEFNVNTTYGEHSQYRKDTLYLPPDSYQIEFPIAYNNVLNIPILLDEKEIIRQAIHHFVGELYATLKSKMDIMNQATIVSECP